jgi:hypothetical protein
LRFERFIATLHQDIDPVDLPDPGRLLAAPVTHNPASTGTDFYSPADEYAYTHSGLVSPDPDRDASLRAHHLTHTAAKPPQRG